MKLTEYNPLSIFHHEQGRLYFNLYVAHKRFAVDITCCSNLSDIAHGAPVYQLTTSYDCGRRVIFRKAYKSLARCVRSRLVEKLVFDSEHHFAKV